MKTIHQRILSLAIASSAMMASVSSAEETAAPNNEKMQWWRQARYGMFIHWGLYAVPGGAYNGKDVNGYAEWIMNFGKIPVDEYAKFAKEFKPVKFNADAWAAVAKEAGMKYLVITAKHHDGFCMYPTKVDDFNIVKATPFKRDPIKELAAACAKQGIKFGVYYSQAQDWSHPGGGIWGEKWDKKQDGSYDEYLQKVSIPQVRELLASVKPAVLWFDTPIDMKPERTQEFLEVLNRYPALIYNNRLGNGVHGDTETPEQEIPANGFPGRDWETCMTMNDTWGYRPKDHNYKSTETLLRNLIDIASKNGNYLLNVGPTPEGVMPEPQIQRLKEVGAWLKVNGEAIYGTSGGPFKKTPSWGRATRRAGKLYLHVFTWPKDGKLLVRIPNPVKAASLFGKSKQALKTKVTPEGLEIQLPASAPDPIASVIALDVVGEIALIEDAPLSQTSDGTLTLTAADATLHGKSIKLETRAEPNIGYWSDLNDSLTWQAKITQPGEFDVVFNLACAPDSEGGEFTFFIGDTKFSGKTTNTGAWETYQEVNVGHIRIDQAGPARIAISPTSKPGPAVMNLRSVTLKPAAAK